MTTCSDCVWIRGYISWRYCSEIAINSYCYCKCIWLSKWWLSALVTWYFNRTRVRCCIVWQTSWMHCQHVFRWIVTDEVRRYCCASWISYSINEITTIWIRVIRSKLLRNCNCLTRSKYINSLCLSGGVDSIGCTTTWNWTCNCQCETNRFWS